MDGLLKADIFFFITSFAVIFVTVLFSIVLWYVIRILRAIADIVERVREGSETLAEDAARLRSQIADGSLFAGIIGRFVGRRSSRRRTSRSETE